MHPISHLKRLITATANQRYGVHEKAHRMPGRKLGFGYVSRGKLTDAQMWRKPCP
jgi:hypothetical protein